MLNNTHYINFKPCTILPVAKKYDDLWFLFNENEMLVIKQNEELRIPTREDFNSYLDTLVSSHYIGDFRDIPCFCAEISLNPNKNLFSFVPLRKISSLVDNEVFLSCGRAYQILHWIHNNKFCGRCGHETKMKENELSRHCPKCNLSTYPRISPAVIVTVTKGDQILLAHNIRFPNGLHSNVAGFVEPSETLEDCVKREVLEEVGVKVKNIRYFGNQPWPYPDSLMIGFFAEYDGGEIKVDNCEITHADWYSIDNLPLLPEKTTIARKMIDSFISSLK